MTEEPVTSRRCGCSCLLSCWFVFLLLCSWRGGDLRVTAESMSNDTEPANEPASSPNVNSHLETFTNAQPTVVTQLDVLLLCVMISP